MSATDASSGDRLTFEAIVRDQTTRLFSLAYSILRDVQESEDAVQDTLELAWKGWKSQRDPESRPAWLRTICIRRSLRVRGGLLKRFFLDERRPEFEQRQPEQADPDLDRAFRNLSIQQRAVVVLHYQHGFSLDECADLMKCRPGTARSHLNRALDKLRAELGDEKDA
jgi:RNA polymerase sigma-70 factor (ECF subfamily)